MLHVLYVQSVVDIKKGKKHPVDIEKLMPFLLSHDKLTYNFVNIMPFTKLRLVLSAILRKLILRTLY